MLSKANKKQLFNLYHFLIINPHVTYLELQIKYHVKRDNDDTECPFSHTPVEDCGSQKVFPKGLKSLCRCH